MTMKEILTLLVMQFSCFFVLQRVGLRIEMVFLMKTII
uniref:Uncharacterized protein n=1 Tax=Anguilla anguilla TaxID=7936 RepID=A0A0E9S3N2_ANGAN